MLKQPIYISSLASISALGNSSEDIWNRYLNSEHYIVEKEFSDTSALVAELPREVREEIQQLRASDSKYKSLDDSVLYAIYCSRKAIKKAGWNSEDNFGVNIGSSRGATQLFEKYHEEFLSKGKSSTLTSPTTTLGNISSWIFSYSANCSLVSTLSSFVSVR